MTTLSATPAVPAQRPPLEALRRAVAGAVLEVGDLGYDERVTPWNLAVPMRPTAVVAVATAEDVAHTVRFARLSGLTVGVQTTGHGAVARLAGDLLISTRDLDEVHVSPEGWARVGAGVTWGRVVEAAAVHGLAPLNGSSGGVGVVGYTTGGGVGPMVRTFGLACDRVRAFEVVTGDGEVRRVTPTEQPELFFALRGGKGAAGIVTAIELDLVPVPQFYGGALYFDGADAAAVVDRWRTWAPALPEAGTSSFVLLQLPPLPSVPPPLAGRLTIGVRLLWTGEPDEGRRLLDELRAAAPVVLDDVAVKPYTAVDSVHADPVDPMPVHERAMLLTGLSADAAETLLAVAGPGSASPQIAVEVRQLGGAYARPGEHASAFDHREAAYSLLTVGMAPDPTVPGHAELVQAAMSDWDTGGAWPNFAPASDAASARRAYAPQTLARLRDVVRAYDPDAVLAGGAFARQATDLG